MQFKKQRYSGCNDVKHQNSLLFIKEGFAGQLLKQLTN